MPQQFSKRKAIWLLAGIGSVFLILLISLAVLISAYTTPANTQSFATFSSCGEVEEWLLRAQKSTIVPPWYYRMGAIAEDSVSGGSEGSPITAPQPASPDYSTTNVQVAGVDELDRVKTDGEYVYISEGSSVFIRPIADISEATAEISVVGSPIGIFLSGDRLVVVSNDYTYIDYGDQTSSSSSSSGSAEIDIAPSYYNPGTTITVVVTYDLTTISAPKQVSYLIFDGYYNSARLHDGNVYLIANYAADASQLAEFGVDRVLPHYFIAADMSDAADKVGAGDYPLMADCNQISRYGDLGTTFTNVVAFPVDDPTQISAKVLLGSAETIYMSQRNLLLTSTRYQDDSAAEPDTCDAIETIFAGCIPTAILPDYSGPADTEVYRLSISDTELKFEGSARVPGTVLDQFSLDEHSGYFRVATTGNTSEGRWSTEVNNMYVLDENMQVAGKVEGLAPTEQIYAVRYLGDRAYMVTYKQVDPFYVIDLSDPRNPEVLGELKIPGFSEYLHPYDENHIIGVGQEATTSGRVTGVKVALFDVTDQENPIEVAKVDLGDVGSSTQVSYDHKAFLFDREKGLMVIPVTSYEGDADDRYYGTYDFIGFKVFDISDSGITERGRITAELDGEETEYFYMTSPRSFYVNEDLFTYTDGILKQSVLSTLQLVEAVQL
jgi:inhibitor of cysteine peptidase